LFALANTGVVLSTDILQAALRSPITWAIVAARVIGKPVGILLVSRTAIGVGVADRPGGAADRPSIGVAMSAGMGFTVALFISELAFTDPVQRSDATLGILGAAIAAAALSLIVLTWRRASEYVP
jgi:Na+/H+ antiporter NhaA